MIEIHTLQEHEREAVLALAPRLTVGVAPWRDPEAVGQAVEGWARDAVEAHDPRTAPVLVAVDDGAVVGFVAAGTRRHWSGATDGYVGELVTARSAEGRGIGAALMAAAERWAVAQGCTRLTLETGAANTRAIAFYEHLGYVHEEVVLTRRLTTAGPRS